MPFTNRCSKLRNGNISNPCEQLAHILHHLLLLRKQHIDVHVIKNKDPSHLPPCERTTTPEQYVYTKREIKCIRNEQRMRGMLDITPVELVCYGSVAYRVVLYHQHNQQHTFRKTHHSLLNNLICLLI